MFSLEQLLFSVAGDSRTNGDILDRILPMIVEVFDRELTDRKKIKVCPNSFPIETKIFYFMILILLGIFC